MQSVVSYFRSRLMRGRTRGFTLIEGLVVIGIVVLISSQIIVTQRGYGAQARLRAILEDVATSVRQTQVYATSVHMEQNNGFRSLYGLHFTTSNNRNGFYTLFSEPIPNETPNQLGCPSSAVDPKNTNLNCVYDANANEAVTNGTYQLPSNYKISKICTARRLTGQCTSRSSINLVYVRPFYETRFFYRSNSHQSNISYTDIQIEGPDKETGTVRVLAGGYAYVL